MLHCVLDLCYGLISQTNCSMSSSAQAEITERWPLANNKGQTNKAAR